MVQEANRTIEEAIAILSHKCISSEFLVDERRDGRPNRRLELFQPSIKCRAWRCIVVRTVCAINFVIIADSSPNFYFTCFEHLTLCPTH